MSCKYMSDRVKMVKQHKHSVKFNFYLCMAYSACLYLFIYVSVAHYIKWEVAYHAIYICLVCALTMMCFNYFCSIFKELPAASFMHAIPHAVYMVTLKRLIIEKDIRPVKSYKIKLHIIAYYRLPALRQCFNQFFSHSVVSICRWHNNLHSAGTTNSCVKNRY